MNSLDLRMSWARYIEKMYDPETVYYPACGSDRVPKEVFGSDRVTHLSLPGKGSELADGSNYFDHLGEGIKMYGRMEKSPLVNKSVDLIWLKLEGIVPSEEAIADFARVLKPGGHICVEEYRCIDLAKWKNLLKMFESFQRLPVEIEGDGKSVFGVMSRDIEIPTGLINDYESEIVLCGSEEEMIHLVTSGKNLKGIELVPRYAVFER